MNHDFVIRKKTSKKGAEGFDTISLRLPVNLLEIIQESADKTNHSRNEFINILIRYSIDHMTIEE